MRKAKDVGLVMQLGGDLMFGMFLSKTSGAKLFAIPTARKEVCQNVLRCSPPTR